jgi:serine/threonine protein kinase
MRGTGTTLLTVLVNDGLTFHRAQELDRIRLSNELSDARKEQKKNTAQKQEANFLRFLRTTERPQNYSTLKIIGKGAFGEVKLVQRKRDQKVYALKSLVKTEMVCSEPCAAISHHCLLTTSIAQERSTCSCSR